MQKLFTISFILTVILLISYQSQTEPLAALPPLLFNLNPKAELDELELTLTEQGFWRAFTDSGYYIYENEGAFFTNYGLSSPFMVDIILPNTQAAGRQLQFIFTGLTPTDDATNRAEQLIIKRALISKLGRPTLMDGQILSAAQPHSYHWHTADDGSLAVKFNHNSFVTFIYNYPVDVDKE
ncbi:MAG: hypothetical protein FWE37_06210 [Spirochaetaceae bacterium]|nr:hypothetical protein [Spirochaetaceae bacterium]